MTMFQVLIRCLLCVFFLYRLTSYLSTDNLAIFSSEQNFLATVSKITGLILGNT